MDLLVSSLQSTTAPRWTASRRLSATLELVIRDPQQNTRCRLQKPANPRPPPALDRHVRIIPVGYEIPDPLLDHFQLQNQRMNRRQRLQTRQPILRPLFASTLFHPSILPVFNRFPCPSTSTFEHQPSLSAWPIIRPPTIPPTADTDPPRAAPEDRPPTPEEAHRQHFPGCWCKPWCKL